MKKTLIMLLALSVLAVSSCDFVRTLAGRPTQAQLDRMRAERNRQEEARHQATLDSMARVEKQMADSLEALEKHLLDSLTQSQGTVLNPSKLGGLFTTKLENKLKSCNAVGYTATIISFRNGLLAVAICPSNSLDETLRKLKEIRGTEVCPQDGWILINS